MEESPRGQWKSHNQSLLATDESEEGIDEPKEGTDESVQGTDETRFTKMERTEMRFLVQRYAFSYIARQTDSLFLKKTGKCLQKKLKVDKFAPDSEARWRGRVAVVALL